MAKVTIDILAETRGFNKGLDESQSKLGKFGGALSKFGPAVAAGAGVAAVAIGAVAVEAVKSASDAQQSLGATSTVFGKYADSIVKNSDKAATSVGLSANEYRESANLIGALLGNKGFKGNALVGATDELVKKGADLAATFGGPTTDAVDALSAAFKGEFDSLDKYGISLNADKVATEANALAKKKYGTELKNLSAAQQENIKAQATQNEINKQSAKATGAFGRETNTLAHQQQVFTAQLENLKAKLGTALLPVLTKVMTFITEKVMPGFDNMKETLGPVIAAVKGFFKAGDDAGKGTGISKIGDTFKKLVPQIQSAMASVMEIVRGVLAIIAVLWNRYGSTIIAYVTATMQNVMQVIGGVLKVIKGIVNVVLGVLTGDWSRAWSGIKQIVSGIWQVIKGVVKQGILIIKTLLSTTMTTIKSAWKGAWNGIKNLLTGAWSAMKTAVRNGITNIRDYAAGIKGKVTNAIGNVAGALTQKGKDFLVGLLNGLKSYWSANVKGWLALGSKVKSAVGSVGSVLYGTGSEIINGLWSGLKAKWESVKSWFGDITSQIPDLKGPLSRDKKLLTKNGEAIIGGLLKGLESQYPKVERSLQSLTTGIGATDLAFANGSITNRSNASGGDTYITIKVEATPGTDKTALAKELADIIAYGKAKGVKFA